MLAPVSGWCELEHPAGRHRDIERIEVVRGSNSAAFWIERLSGRDQYHYSGRVAGQGRVLASTTAIRVCDERVRLGGQVAGADVRLTVRQQSDWGYRFRPAAIRETPSTSPTISASAWWTCGADVPVGDRDELRFHSGHLENRLDTGRSDELLNTPRQMSQSLYVRWVGDIASRSTRN